MAILKLINDPLALAFIEELKDNVDLGDSKVIEALKVIGKIALESLKVPANILNPFSVGSKFSITPEMVEDMPTFIKLLASISENIHMITTGKVVYSLLLKGVEFIHSMSLPVFLVLSMIALINFASGDTAALSKVIGYLTGYGLISALFLVAEGYLKCKIKVGL